MILQLTAVAYGFHLLKIAPHVSLTASCHFYFLMTASHDLSVADHICPEMLRTTVFHHSSPVSVCYQFLLVTTVSHCSFLANTVGHGSCLATSLHVLETTGGSLLTAVCHHTSVTFVGLCFYPRVVFVHGPSLVSVLSPGLFLVTISQNISLETILAQGSFLVSDISYIFLSVYTVAYDSNDFDSVRKYGGCTLDRKIYNETRRKQKAQII